MDRLGLFRIFVQVADSASFSRAAEIGGVSRSSVSQVIGELEARLGVRLLHRTTRKVVPTQEGLAFLDRCRRVLDEVEDAESLFRTASPPSGLVRVDLPGRIGRLVVAPRLPEFLDRHPEIEVMLGVRDRSIRLLEEGADCVLRVGALADSELAARSLGTLPVITVASPDYLSRHGTPDTPAALEGHLMVHYCAPSTGRNEPFEWTENGEVHIRTLPGRVSVDAAEPLIACCLAGLGLIQVPAYDVRASLDTGELVEVLPRFRPADLPIALLFPHRRQVPRRTRVFADWLAGIMAEAMRP